MRARLTESGTGQSGPLVQAGSQVQPRPGGAAGTRGNRTGVRWDGHTHTHFCRHGSGHHLNQYLDRAQALGFCGYTVTEHPPLPPGWLADEGVMRQLAMDPKDLGAYMEEAGRCKRDRAGVLDVRVGLELDYLPGSEDFTVDLVDRWLDRLDEVIVSVHFLPGRGGMRCVDLSADDVRDGLIDYYGSVNAVADVYYDCVEAAIALAARLPVPARIGHVLLIEKFRLAVGEVDGQLTERRLSRILELLGGTGVGLDVNTAGFRKEWCRKPYVPESFLKRCAARGVECVFGSDAHHPDEVGAGWDWYAQVLG
ncbi:MAG: histidinol-phosphatase HisJ [Alicyclobacillus sp.]|nr:histidinol-phosphatase HisJ [Alicyclobacillus sp.]